MFQLDDTFLQSVGLGVLPDEQKQPFLQHLREELELRVGTKLATGLNDAQLTEFEGIIERAPGKVDAWLDARLPGYVQHVDYQNALQKLVQQNQGQAISQAQADDVKAEFAATKWLEENRGDYKQVVSATMNELKAEILANRERFLAA